MSNNFSTVHITQYKPDSFSVDVDGNTFQWEGSVDERTFDTFSGDYHFTHFPLIQNPMPYALANGWLTTDSNRWSDSPSLDPTRPDNQRYSYGREGMLRYGKLDGYSGVIIKQTVAGKSSDYNMYDEQQSSDVSVGNVQQYVYGNVLMEEIEQVSNQVDVYQYSFTVFSRPKAFSYKNPIDTDVSIRLSNYVYPLNSGTITLSLDGENKTDLDVVPYHTGLGGFDATWNNNKVFDYDHQVNVVWEVYDTTTPANKITIRYWFRTVKDLTGPRIFNVSPYDNEIGVLVGSCISFDLRDFELGVNISSLELYVNNILAPIENMTITELSTEDGYSVLYCPVNNFLYGDIIPVSLYVEDNSPEKNSLFYVFSFTTEESTKPLMVENTPKEFNNKVSIETDVGVIVSDGGCGLDKDTLVLTIDGVDETEVKKSPIIYRQE